MPFITVEVPADVAFAHNGIVVYHVYEENQKENGPSKYAFSFIPDANYYDDDDDVFNVRDLPNWEECKKPPYLLGEDDTPENLKLWDEFHKNGVEEQHIRLVIKAAIAAGDLDNYLKPKTDTDGVAEQTVQTV